MPLLRKEVELSSGQEVPHFPKRYQSEQITRERENRRARGETCHLPRSWRFPARSCSTIPEKDKELKELLLVQCIEIFPVNSVNHLLNNGGLIISVYSFSIRLVNVSLHQDCQKTLR